MLEVENLTGGYHNTEIIKNLNFTVKEGELLGLIGLNGAGKSTTIKHLIGILHPMKGSIILNGVPLSDSINYRKQIAYIPESPILYEELTLKDHINLVIEAYQLNSEQTWIKANELLKLFRLENRLEWLPINFSKGMKQKVMIVCAFITNAKLLIIDEPFLGLDPLAIDDFLNLIEERKKISSILMSTHVLDAAEKHCDKFALVNKGKIDLLGSVTDFKDHYNQPNATLNDIYLSLARSGDIS